MKFCSRRNRDETFPDSPETEMRPSQSKSGLMTALRLRHRDRDFIPVSSRYSSDIRDLLAKHK